jgi:hypothetical protein
LWNTISDILDIIGDKSDTTIDTLWGSINANNELIQNNAKDIEDINIRTEFIDGTASEAFYIIDKAKNVIAYIDEKGIHAIEFDLATFNTDTNEPGSIETFSELRQRVNDAEDVSASIIEAVGLPLTSGVPAYNDGISDLYN